MARPRGDLAGMKPAAFHENGNARVEKMGRRYLITATAIEGYPDSSTMTLGMN